MSEQYFTVESLGPEGYDEYLKSFAEASAEYWFGDIEDEQVEAIYNWAKTCEDPEVRRILAKENIYEDEDEYLMNTFLNASKLSEARIKNDLEVYEFAKDQEPRKVIWLDAPVLDLSTDLNVRDAVEKIYRTLEAEDIYPEDVYCSDPSTQQFEMVIRGDWKHDHAAADHIMFDKFHLSCVNVRAIGDTSDDDYFSARRKYRHTGLARGQKYTESTTKSKSSKSKLKEEATYEVGTKVKWFDPPSHKCAPGYGTITKVDKIDGKYIQYTVEWDDGTVSDEIDPMYLKPYRKPAPVYRDEYYQNQWRRTEESAKKLKKSVDKKNLKEDRYLSTEAELDAIFNGDYEDWYDGIDPDPEKAKYIHKAAQDAGMSDLEYVNREEVLDQLDAENEFIYDLEASDVSVENFKIEAARNIFEGYKQEIEEKGSATGSYGHQMTADYDLCEDILEGAELFINDNWTNSFSSHSIEEMIAITAQYYNDPRCTKVKALYDALVEWASGFNALVEGYVTGFRTIDIVEPSGYVATETTDDIFDDGPDSFEDYETDEDSLYESKKLKEKFGVKGHYGIEVNAIAGKQYGFSTVDINGKPNTDEEPFEAKTKEAVLASKMYAACVKRYGQDRVRVIKF